MYKYLPMPAASKMSLIMFIAMSSTLAACSDGGLALDDTYVPAANYDRYPIEVVRGPVKMEISSRHGTLQSSQINADFRIFAFCRVILVHPGSLFFARRPAVHPARWQGKSIKCSCKAAFRQA